MSINLYNYKSIILKSILTKNLSKTDINLICKLKDQEWKFGIKSQKNWFKKNVKLNDEHNLLYIKSELVGYTLLRKKTFINKKLKKRFNYLLLDAIIIKKQNRGKKLSNLLMSLNNYVISQTDFFSILICDKKLVIFYKKYGWIELEKNYFILNNMISKKKCMIFNFKKTKKFILYSAN